MTVSRFDEEVPILHDDDHKQVGLCVMGPIGTGDRLIWMRVWAWQQDGDNIVAASTGDAGVHVDGAHKLAPKDDPPFGPPEKKWMVQTGFEEASADYNPEKPVLVQALALVESGGDRSIVQWSQAVKIRHHQ